MTALRSNLAFNLANQLLLIAFPVFLNIYLVRVLHLEDLGKWYLVNSAAALVQLLITAPHFWLVKLLSVGNGDPRRTVAAGMMTYLGLLLTVAPFYILYVLWIAPETVFVAALVFVQLLMSTLACEYYFHAYHLQRFLMVRRLVTRSILVVLLLSFVREPSDFHLFVGMVTAIFIIEHLINFGAMLLRHGLAWPDRSTFGSVSGSVRQMLPFNATHNTLPHIVLLAAPRVFDLETVAILSVLVRLVNMVTTLVTSSINVIFPFLNATTGTADIKMRLCLMTGLVAATIGMIGFVLHQPLASIFLGRALNAEQVQGFGYLCAYVVIHALYNYIAFNTFVAQSKAHLVTLCNVLILGCFGSAAMLLSASFNLYAAAMTTSAFIGLLCLWALHLLQRKNRL
ncbi:hypothetical protein [Sulfitobacter pontiacus]|uniref:hypothetical protein n=1 Tax=Sulfitobacter pontiacus TaxID=60137 RepID=UPI001051A852|nr:hypothetical protein [Sulfitobacter pontiacus]